MKAYQFGDWMRFAEARFELHWQRDRDKLPPIYLPQ